MGRQIWYCDASKNSECKKNACYIHGGPCSFTFDKEFAVVACGKPLKGPMIQGEDEERGESMQNETKPNPRDRLEDALLMFIERVVEKATPEPAELAAVPAMAEVLVKMWRD